MTMKRLFIGGPWDGQVHDLDAIAKVDPRYGCIQVPAGTCVATGGVSITVMTSSVSRELGRPVLAALIALAGIDVVWQHDPDDPG